MEFEIPLSNAAMRFFSRLNAKIANLLLELRQKEQKLEALKKMKK